jgi:AraC-like DNA-binding protein
MYAPKWINRFSSCDKLDVVMSVAHKHFSVRDVSPGFAIGSARIAAYLELPSLLREFGVDVQDVLEVAGVHADLFGSPENLIPYSDVGRLLAASAELTHCDYIGLLLGQRIRLATMGLAGQIAMCAETAGEGLRRFAEFFTLHNTAATLSIVATSGFVKLAYAVTDSGTAETSQLQLGAMASGFNILQDLCGPDWLPALVTIAGSAPSNLRPCQKFFHSPLRFESDETALYFEGHWLDRTLPPVDPVVRRRIEAQVRERRAAILADLPTTLRQILRRQLALGEVSMDKGAARLAMHRRTLDRRLNEYGLDYSDLLESVRRDVACQLLRDTHLPMQDIAESLHYTSAANFSTAFRRWTGVTPSSYRRQSS